MAAKTQLSLSATPGRRYSFSAKTEAVDEWVDIILRGVEVISGKAVRIIGAYKLR